MYNRRKFIKISAAGASLVALSNPKLRRPYPINLQGVSQSLYQPGISAFPRIKKHGEYLKMVAVPLMQWKLA
jgi:hypothetical protein